MVEKQHIFSEILSAAYSLMTDVFGKYWPHRGCSSLTAWPTNQLRHFANVKNKFTITCIYITVSYD